MLISQNILTALRGLMANKLRSALTILGIVIGVAAVVALMAIGNGATSSITNRITSNGSNILNIQAGRSQRPAPGAQREGGPEREGGPNRALAKVYGLPTRRAGACCGHDAENSHINRRREYRDLGMVGARRLEPLSSARTRSNGRITASRLTRDFADRA